MADIFQVELFLSAFAILFVLIDPPGCAPVFATLTRGTSKAHQRDMAVRSVAVASFILVLFALGGEWVFAKLGISLDALRIAGGIMLFIIGLNMVFEKRQERRETRAEDALEDVDDPEDISVFPMGIPMVAGPGTMASLLILLGDAGGWEGFATVMAALAAVLVLTLLSFLTAPAIMRLLGENFANVLTRVFGVLLATLAAQFILDGVAGSLFAGFS